MARLWNSINDILILKDFIITKHLSAFFCNVNSIITYLSISIPLKSTENGRLWNLLKSNQITCYFPSLPAPKLITKNKVPFL
jgi:hypothetical protein